MPRTSEGCRPTTGDALIAGALAAAVSGLPSTCHALLTGGDPLQAAFAAGRLLLPGERRPARLLLAAATVHLGLSLGWAMVLSRVLPRRPSATAGAIAGLGIAALDLGLAGRRIPVVASLPQAPQVADHIAYGAVVAAVLRRRRDAGR